VVTADENDHFRRRQPDPATCDGVTIPCTYSQIGEVNANIKGLLVNPAEHTTPFGVHADSAPNYYLNGNPTQTDPTTRAFEKSVAAVTATNPYTGTTAPIANYLADQTEMNILHMVTGDPLRTADGHRVRRPELLPVRRRAELHRAVRAGPGRVRVEPR